MSTTFQKLATVLYCACFILIPLGILSVALDANSSQIQLNVSKASGFADTLQRFQQASIVGPGSIVIAHPSPMMRYVAPGKAFEDPLYDALACAAAIVFALFFYDFRYKQPFTDKALTGLRVSLCVLLLFMVADFWRYDWLEKQIAHITGNEYHYVKPTMLTAPEYWIFFVTVRLLWIFKKGVALQNEADLIV